jgi:1-acyl-sn-glycerol-3-phosphate acyltransferase
MTRVDTTMATSSRPAKAFYTLARTCCVVFCRVWMRMTVEGLEHVPAEGGFVLAPVHRSNIDTPISSVVTRRRLRYMGKDTLWEKPFWRWFLSALGGFPVSRGSIDLEALSRCIEVLKGGSCSSPRASGRAARSSSRCSTVRPTSRRAPGYRSSPSASVGRSA